MGMVYKAFDTILERDVAIKVMHPHLLDDPKSAERFLREARAAAKLVHPNVVTIHEIGEADCGRFIVMEYIKGLSLSEFLKHNGILEWELAVKFIQDILSALSYAHQLGILHRDIKTDNILLTDQKVIKILDFGIAKMNTKVGMTAAGDILGTIEYMAPEQMMGEDPDTRCDIYAAGTVLYQLLTKKLPYEGETAVTILYQKLNEDPPPPSFYNDKILPNLDKIVLKALARNKVERWASAEDFDEALQKCLEKQTISQTSPFSDPEFPENNLEEEVESDELTAVFIGRTKEFSSLINLFSQVKHGNGQTVLVMGEAGVGKTTLIDHFRNYVEANKAWVLYGACLYQEGMDAYLPYIDALRGFFSKESYSLPEEERQKIKDMVREKVPLLLEFTERFTTTFGEHQNQSLQTEEEKPINLFEGIYLLVSLISERQPVVLVIDDLQWADEASLRLFHYLSRQVTGNRILQIGISRTDRNDLQRNGKPTMAFDVLLRLRQEGICKEYTLKRLTKDENDKLIDESLSQTVFSDDFYNLIYEETKGNPLFVIESLKMLREKGDIYTEDSVWYNRTDLKKIVVPNRVEDVFVRRLSSLNESERDMLQVAAVLGNKFIASHLAMILEEPKIKLLKTLQKIERDLQIIASTEDGFQFEHPMLRELLYNEIPKALQREYHGMIAEQLEKIYNGNYGALVGDVAEHFRRGGLLSKAIPLLHKAGMRSFRLYAYNEASIFFENLLSSMADNEEELSEKIDITEIYLKLTISQEEIGRWEDCINNYNALLHLCEEKENIKGQIDALIRLGRIYIKQGNWEKALNVWERCLELVKNHPIPNGLSRIYNNIGIIHFQKGDYDAALSFFDKTLENADNNDGVYDKAHALTNMGIISNIRGEFDQALNYYKESLEIYVSKDNSKGEAQVYHNMGMTYADMSEWEQAIEAFQKCFMLADEVEDKTLLALTELNMSKTYLKQGDYREAKKYADKALKFFKRVKDVLSIAEIDYIYGLLLSKQNRYDKAEGYLRQSIQFNLEKEYWEGYIDACEAFADICRKQNKIDEAVEYYKKATTACNKINLSEKSSLLEEKINELHEKVDFETSAGKIYV
jgi:serine/threonine protein kinase/Tfp pilus assembly protein PilF